MVDQIVFAVMDLAMGLWADRVAFMLRRLGPTILAISTVSCAGFLALPHAAILGAPAVLLLILVWTATSSALRAPLWVLLAKYVATPRMPFLAALSLSGVAVSSALSPYLGVTLRDLDPRIPFAVSAVTLLVSASGVIWVEQYLARGASANVAVTSASPGVGAAVILFFAGSGLLSIGFQAHFFLNSGAQYLRFAKPTDLEHLMPVFWIGYNLLMFPGAALAGRYSALPVMASAAALGVIGMLAAGLAGSLVMLITGQFFAGGAWGGASMAAFTGSMAFGHKGREGLMVGVLSSLFALAALLRIATAVAVADKGAAAADVLPWLPPGLWLIGGLALLAAALASPRTISVTRHVT
jgi:hypothetical protein